MVILAITAFVSFEQWSFSDDYAPREGILAFPGAEGFGAHTRGGRYGHVLLVTNLEDYHPAVDKPISGSLRKAIETAGPRIVVFRVSGTIPLKTTLNITKPYLTLAGQTAPGDGICLKHYGVLIRTHQVILRYMRFRPGDEIGRKRQEKGKTFQTDALSIEGYWINGYVIGPDVRDVIIDHCSASWASDEVMSLSAGGRTGAIRNVTVQWCIISEALNNSFHHKGAHGYGSIIAGENVTFHHNIYAHVTERAPAATSYPLDFRNNLIYNARGHGYGKLNYVGNYLKRIRGNYAFDVSHPNPDRIAEVYAADNYLDDGGESQHNESKRVCRVGGESKLARQPNPVARVATDSAREAYRRMLKSCGAVLPARDAVDERLIADIKAGKGEIIDSQRDVGGWPKLKSLPAPKDSDNDGMPDEWEMKYGLNPHDLPEGPPNADAVYHPNDSAKDPDGDGYTNIEEFLNGTNPIDRQTLERP